MIEIRELTIDDLPCLVKLLEQLWVDRQIDNEAVKKVIEKGLKHDHQFYICAVDDNKLVGFCSLSLKNNLWTSANLGSVDELVVENNYRNRGIGKMLMQEIEEIGRRNECKRIELESSFHRTEAHLFYEKLGFEKRAYWFTKEL